MKLEVKTAKRGRETGENTTKVLPIIWINISPFKYIFILKGSIYKTKIMN